MQDTAHCRCAAARHSRAGLTGRRPRVRGGVEGRGRQESTAAGRGASVTLPSRPRGSSSTDPERGVFFSSASTRARAASAADGWAGKQHTRDDRRRCVRRHPNGHRGEAAESGGREARQTVPPVALLQTPLVASLSRLLAASLNTAFGPLSPAITPASCCQVRCGRRAAPIIEQAKRTLGTS